MDKVIYNSMGSQCLKTKALDREGYANERNIAPEKKSDAVQCDEPNKVMSDCDLNTESFPHCYSEGCKTIYLSNNLTLNFSTKL